MDARVTQYLQRIGLSAAPSRDLAGLAALQQAHRGAIAFENLDIPMRRGIRIDSDSVFAKLVSGRRGGYCFEQNRLYADMLAALGFPNRSLLARVRLSLPDGYVPPRTHVLLLVELGDERWIADAGFGGSFTPPMALHHGSSATSYDGAQHRLRSLGPVGSLDGEWLLERAGPAGATDGRAAPHSDWQPQYSFDLAEVAQEDLEMSNHWTSTRPETRFTTMQIASIALPDGFAALSDRRLTVYRPGGTVVRDIDDATDYAATLRDVFGLVLSEDEIASLPLFAPTSP